MAGDVPSPLLAAVPPIRPPSPGRPQENIPGRSQAGAQGRAQTLAWTHCLKLRPVRKRRKPKRDPPQTIEYYNDALRVSAHAPTPVHVHNACPQRCSVPGCTRVDTGARASAPVHVHSAYPRQCYDCTRVDTHACAHTQAPRPTPRHPLWPIPRQAEHPRLVPGTQCRLPTCRV